MSSTRLIATPTAEDHWQAVVRPWLLAQAEAAWKDPRPTVVLTPGRAEGFHLRSRIIAEKAALPGLRFWTPSDARKFLLGHYALKAGTATQAELHLLARACAEKLSRHDGADNPSLHSVAREPSAFLRAYELLLGAGWNPASDGAEYGRELAREFQRQLEKARIATQAGLHRELWSAAAASSQPLIANLLLSGFNAAHWPLWDLLKAATLSAEQAVVGLSEPRFFAEGADQLWHSSWEEFTKSEILHDSAADRPPAAFASLAESYAAGSRQELPGLDLTFCVTPDLQSQVRGVVLHALEFLRRDDCTRLGIVFPQANALALGVADELRRLNVPMNDGPGALMPGLFEKRSWSAWLALQDEPGVATLIAWLRACQAEGFSCGAKPGLSAEVIASVTSGALGETLVDDLAFLARHLEGPRERQDRQDVAEYLRERIQLPDAATFARFLELTRAALQLEGWKPWLAELEPAAPAWLARSKESLPRRTYIEWLREASDSQSRMRGKEGSHFYGRVHLLVYGQLAGQAWSHLILTGMNEGVWPRVFDAGAFGSRYELETLNERARVLNRRARTQGPHGEGDHVVREGHGHCLLPLERQQLALRDLCAALEVTSGAVCLAALTTEEGRGLLPSDFFNHACQIKTDRTLDEEAFRQMASASTAWVAAHDALFMAADATAPAEIEATRVAYKARRDAGQPFGPYEFAYDVPPERPIQLWCKQWEEAWDHPAKVWLESVVGAAPWPEGTLSWPGAIGTWVHRWLAQALKDRREQPETPLADLVAQAAGRLERSTRERAEASGLVLYPWWEHVWLQARTIALDLARALEPLLEGREFEAEYRLPRGIMAALPGAESADFELKGRIDLVLFETGATLSDPTAPNFAGTSCWVIDFKTGSAGALTQTEMDKGRGIQPLLYALAMRSLGAGPTRFSFLTRSSPSKKPLDLDVVLGGGTLFRSLEIMHRRGVFGMKPGQDNAYGYAPAYPLATTPIASHVLEAKWALVHGGLALPETGDEDE